MWSVFLSNVSVFGAGNDAVFNRMRNPSSMVLKTRNGTSAKGHIQAMSG
jgi:hypothetical protein